MRLFRNRNLNIAILISTSCHVLFAFSIAPVLTSSGIKKNSTDICFLGSILEKITTIPDKSFNLQKENDITPKVVSLRLPQGLSKSKSFESDKESAQGFKDDNKKSGFKLYYKKKPKVRIRFKGLLVSGAARNRKLLYKPDLPVKRILPTEFNSDSSTTVRFNISRHGFVETPECIRSSGSSEVDQMALRYIRKWQFTPLEISQEASQEGMVRLVFDK